MRGRDRLAVDRALLVTIGVIVFLACLSGSSPHIILKDRTLWRGPRLSTHAKPVMFSKNIFIGNLPPHHHNFPVGIQVLQKRSVQNKRIMIFPSDRKLFHVNGVIRHHYAHSEVLLGRFFLSPVFRCRELGDCNYCWGEFSGYFSRGSLAGVNEIEFKYERGSDVGAKSACVVISDPRTLINYEVGFHILPLKVSYKSISDGEWNSDYLQKRFPIVRGLIPGILGLFGISWGWWNLKLGRRLPISGITFLFGCFLWMYALIVLLPWSVS